MQNLNIKAGKLPSLVHLPSSKSYANRALILASIKKEKVILSNMPQASDVTILIDSLSEIGLEIEKSNDVVSISNHFPACEHDQNKMIKVGEGGTTARFLASLLLLGHREYTLVLGERLKKRPWKEFLNLAVLLGAKASLKDNLLTIQGPINRLSEIEVDCSQTTQFASGLQLALAFESTKIFPRNMLASHSYLELTNVLIERMKDKSEYVIPMDWSSASYPMCFAALKHPIFFPILKNDKYQSDSKLYWILTELGSLSETSEGIEVRPTTIAKNFDLDVSDCLDLVPALAYLLSHIKGEHKLRGIKNLEYKESHRLEEVIKLVQTFEREASSDESCLYISGSPLPEVSLKDLCLPDDHRMVMSGALFLRHHQGGTISPASSVSKSYPNFFSLLSKD